MEEIAEERTNKLIEHVGGKTIQVGQFPNDFELGVIVFIAGAEMKISDEVSNKLKIVCKLQL